MGPSTCRECGAPVRFGDLTCRYCDAEVRQSHPAREKIEPGVPVAADEFERALPSLVRTLEAALPRDAVTMERDSGTFLDRHPYRIQLVSARVGQYTFELTRQDEELVPTVSFSERGSITEQRTLTSHIEWLIQLRQRLQHVSSPAANEAIGSIASLLGEG